MGCQRAQLWAWCFFNILINYLDEGLARLLITFANDFKLEKVINIPGDRIQQDLNILRK